MKLEEIPIDADVLVVPLSYRKLGGLLSVRRKYKGVQGNNVLFVGTSPEATTIEVPISEITSMKVVFPVELPKTTETTHGH